jgi:hypothetical protein
MDQRRRTRAVMKRSICPDAASFETPMPPLLIACSLCIAGALVLPFLFSLANGRKG